MSRTEKAKRFCMSEELQYAKKIVIFKKVGEEGECDARYARECKKEREKEIAET